jgi:hypothetical protein
MTIVLYAYETTGNVCHMSEDIEIPVTGPMLTGAGHRATRKKQADTITQAVNRAIEQAANRRAAFHQEQIKGAVNA